MSDEEKTVSIVIRGKNLTTGEFEAARKNLAGFSTAATEARTKSLGLSDTMSGLTKIAGAFGISLGIGAVVNFTKSVFAAAGDVADLAAGLGLGRSRTTVPVRRSTIGASVDDVGRALDFMNRSLAGGSEARSTRCGERASRSRTSAR